MLIQVYHGSHVFHLDVDLTEGPEILRLQIFSLTNILPARMEITSQGGSPLRENEDLRTLGWSDGHILHVTETSSSVVVPPIEISQELISRLRSGIQTREMYEMNALLLKARSIVPIERFRVDATRKAAEAMNKNLSVNCFLLRELLAWFKQEFFVWVNNAPCETCGSGDTHAVGSGQPNIEEQINLAGRIELYKCKVCGNLTRFPRYNHPGRLLETRKGRCGEWANAFCLCARACGFQTRYVLDFTDHVWAEVFSEYHDRWEHCDPCENSCDNPLLYSEGWGKKLTYVIAFGSDEVVDVTRRYIRGKTAWEECRKRRTLCSEDVASRTIGGMNAKQLIRARQAGWISTNEESLRRIRNEQESIELERNVTFDDDGVRKFGEAIGRISGSAEWRIARGEIGTGAAAIRALQPALASNTARRTESIPFRVLPHSSTEKSRSDLLVKISVTSTGVSRAGGSTSIKIDNEELAPSKPGINVVSVNTVSGEYDVRWFDTATQQNASQKLLNFVNASASGTCIILSVSGDAAYYFGERGIESLGLLCGLTNPNKIIAPTFRGSYILIGGVGGLSSECLIRSNENGDTISLECILVSGKEDVVIDASKPFNAKERMKELFEKFISEGKAPNAAAKEALAQLREEMSKRNLL